jgi:phospholipid N-methyltransferase
MFSYLKRIQTTGTIISTSNSTIQKMLSRIDFEHAKTVLELGAGKGVVTHQLLKKISSDANLYVFEILAEFAENLKNQYQYYANVHIVQDSAEKISHYLPETQIDACISVLPLSIMDKNTVHNILNTLSIQLSENGIFIQLQYTRRLENVFKKYFDIQKKEYHLWNFPPAHLYILRKKNSVL